MHVDGANNMIPIKQEKILRKKKKLILKNTSAEVYKFDFKTNTLYIPLSETHFARKFEYFNNLEEIEFSIYNKIADGCAMFYKCHNLKKVIFTKKLDLKRVRNLSYLWYECSSLVEIDLSNVVTSGELCDLECAFEKCTSLKTVYFGFNFHSENVKNINALFLGCRNLETINWKAEQPFNNLRYTAHAFNGNKKLKYLDLRGMNFSNVEIMSQMFCSTSPELKVLVNNTFDEEKLVVTF